MPKSPSKRSSRSKDRGTGDHHCVYVVYLRNPKGDGKAGYYVGMTGLAGAAVQEPQAGHQGRGGGETLRRAARAAPVRPPEPDALRESGGDGGRARRQPPQARLHRLRRALITPMPARRGASLSVERNGTESPDARLPP